MGGRLNEHMYKAYGAFPLGLVNENVRPGMLIETRWRPALPLNSYPHFLRQEGFAWELLDLSPDKFQSELHRANILAGEFTEKIGFDGTLPLPQYGLNLSASFNRVRKAKLTIGAVYGRTFTRGFAAHELHAALRKLQETDPARGGWVEDDYLVTECYYTADLTFTFAEQGDMTAKAELQKAGLKIAAEIKANWTDEHTLVLQGAAAAPFAVRGMRV